MCLTILSKFLIFTLNNVYEFFVCNLHSFFAKDNLFKVLGFKPTF